MTPGVVLAVTDSVIALGLALAPAGRGRLRTAGAALAAATGLLVIMFNSGYEFPSGSHDPGAAEWCFNQDQDPRSARWHVIGKGIDYCEACGNYSDGSRPLSPGWP